MVYKSQQDLIPNYITAHIIEYNPPRLLRSSEDKQLVVIKTHLYYGDISFREAADKLGLLKLFLKSTVSRFNYVIQSIRDCVSLEQK